MNKNFVLQGDICYSQDKDTLHTLPGGYLVCLDGVSAGVFPVLPEEYRHLPLLDHRGRLIIPGLTDLHMHAPQFAFRALGMDLELLEWLNRHTFPEEAKYADEAYAARAYCQVVDELKKGPNTRACLFATLHLPATKLLMGLLAEAGLVCLVGKVNMDRNSPENLCEADATTAAAATRAWLTETSAAYPNVKPILTPRFIPSCSDELLRELAEMQAEFQLPLQSHLSENQSEIAWVQELCPESSCYADAYRRFGLLGGQLPTIMAHCVWSSAEEIALLRQQNVMIAHCPQSNQNLASGIAPLRRLLDAGCQVGLGSDIAGGCHSSIFRAMADAIQVSKLHWRLIDENDAPLTINEAFYLGTVGGGSFFGQVGSFAPGYEFDALILDDDALAAPFPLSLEERLARVIYLSDDRQIIGKDVRGIAIFS